MFFSDIFSACLIKLNINRHYFSLQTLLLTIVRSRIVSECDWMKIVITSTSTQYIKVSLGTITYDETMMISITLQRQQCLPEVGRLSTLRTKYHRICIL